jgi:hypothetical protein
MKTIFYLFLFCAFFASAAIADSRIADLSSALQNGGISNFLQVAKSSGFAPPSIPSKWHLENRAKTYDEKQIAIYAREFGFRIVEALEVEALSQRERFADEMLFDQTVMLLDFSDWCVETVGWGNTILANQCLELAATASARLTANTNFPIEKCEQIVSRLSPEWMSPRARAAFLNSEAGTNLFALARIISSDELDMAYGAGRYLARYKNRTPPRDTRLPPNKSLNIAIAKDSLDFFEESPSLPNNTPLRSAWDYRMSERFRGGFGFHIYREAESILTFRKAIGYFPRKFERSAEEQAHLDKMIKLAEKYDDKVTPAEDEPSFDPVSEAFRLAWYNRPNRKIKDENNYFPALRAYKKSLLECIAKTT